MGADLLQPHCAHSLSSLLGRSQGKMPRGFRTLNGHYTIRLYLSLAATPTSAQRQLKHMAHSNPRSTNRQQDWSVLTTAP